MKPLANEVPAQSRRGRRSTILGTDVSDKEAVSGAEAVDAKPAPSPTVIARGCAALLPFVPDLVLEMFSHADINIANEPPDGDAVCRRVQGCVLFCDIKGFTGLMEKFSIQGNAGVEQFAASLNEALGRLIDTVHEFDGTVVQVIGDALLCLFRAPLSVNGSRAGGGLLPATLKAARCAVALHATLSSLTGLADNLRKISDTRLRCKVSLAAGDLLAISAGMKEIHLGGQVFDARKFFFIAGKPLKELSQVEPFCQPDEVMISNDTWTCLNLSHHFNGVHVHPSTVRLVVAHRRQSVMLLAPPSPVLSAPSAPPPPLAPSRALRNTLFMFIPNAIRTRVLQVCDDNQSCDNVWHLLHYLAEFRTVTAVFVHIRGLDFNVAAGGEAELMRVVHQCVLNVQKAVYDNEGSLQAVFHDEKGWVLLACWGLPPLTHTADPVLGATAALALHAAVTPLGLECSVGISTAACLCMLVGQRERCQYSVYSDGINLAARLCMKASGRILSDKATYDEFSSLLDAKCIGDIQLKGKSGDIPAYEVLGKKADERLRRPKQKLIGLLQERGTLLEMIASLAAGGPPSCAIVQAEVGMGKRALVDHVIEQALSRSIAVCVGQGGEHEKESVNSVLASILNSLVEKRLVCPMLPDCASDTPSPAARLSPVAAEAVATVSSNVMASTTPIATLFSMSPGSAGVDLWLGGQLRRRMSSSTGAPLGRSRGSSSSVAVMDATEDQDVNVQRFMPLLHDVAPNLFPSYVGDLMLSSMTPEGRARKIALIMLRLIRKLAAIQPLLLIFRGGEMLGKGVWEFVRDVVREDSGHVMVVVVTAPVPVDSPVRAAYMALLQVSNVKLLELPALTRLESDELVASVIKVGGAGARVPDEVGGFIFEKCQGNPTFTMELAEHLVESKAVAVKAGGEVRVERALECVPGSMHAAMCQWFDSLQYSHQLVLKVASVIGSQFSLSALEAVFPQEINTTSPRDIVLELETLGKIVRVDTSLSAAHVAHKSGADDLVFAFRHLHLHEVAYSLLSFHGRAQLHLDLGKFFRDTGVSDVTLLAWHFSRSSDPSLAFDYVEHAARSSMRKNCLLEASHWVHEGLRLTEICFISRVRCARLHVLDGHLRLQSGELKLAQRAYEKAVELSGYGVPTKSMHTLVAIAAQTALHVFKRVGATSADLVSLEASESLSVLGTSLEGSGRRKEALRLGRGEEREGEGILATISALQGLADVCYETGQTARHLWALLTGANLAATLGPSLTLARFYAALCGAVALHGWTRLARKYERLAQQTTAHHVGDSSFAHVAYLLHRYYASQASWQHAHQMYRVALAGLSDIGEYSLLDNLHASHATFIFWTQPHSKRLKLCLQLFDQLQSTAKARGDNQLYRYGQLWRTYVYMHMDKAHKMDLLSPCRDPDLPSLPSTNSLPPTMLPCAPESALVSLASSIVHAMGLLRLGRLPEAYETTLLAAERLATCDLHRWELVAWLAALGDLAFDLLDLVLAAQRPNTSAALRNVLSASPGPTDSPAGSLRGASKQTRIAMSAAFSTSPERVNAQANLHSLQHSQSLTTPPRSSAAMVLPLSNSVARRSPRMVSAKGLVAPSTNSPRSALPPALLLHTAAKSSSSSSLGMSRSASKLQDSPLHVDPAHVIACCSHVARQLDSLATSHPVALPRALLVRGRLLWVQGKLSAATAVWTRCESVCMRLGSPLFSWDVACLLHARGLAYARSLCPHDRALAHQQLRHALAMYRTLGAVYCENVVSALLRTVNATDHLARSPADCTPRR